MSSENTWREALAMTEDCPPLVNLLEGSHQRDAHVEKCPHCQTELALYREMEQPADQASVKAIGRRLDGVNWAEAGRTGIPAQPQNLWQWLLRPRVLAPASLALASALVLVTVIQLDRPTVKSDLQLPEKQMASQQLRSQQVRALAPLGTVSSAPKELRWEAVSGASRYQVNLMEVDHENVWQSGVSVPQATVSSDALAKMLPGKRLLWEVKAFDADGKQIARSATLEFTTSLQ